MKLELWNYMTSRGIDLTNSGSAERGYSQTDVLEFLELLRAQNFQPLGFEVWHRRDDGTFKMDSLAGWIPTTSQDIDTLFAETTAAIKSTKTNERTIFTLQF